MIPARREAEPVVIETERLSLRRQTAADAPFILRLLNDADFLRYIGNRGVRTVAEAATYIRNGAMASYEAHGFGLYLVQSKPTGEAVGVCGLLKRDFLEDVDLGFALLPEHRRRGFAREAARATIAYAREELGLDRLAAIVSPVNTASIRLLEGLGFRSHGPVEHPDGEDVHLYARAVDELEPLAAEIDGDAQIAANTETTPFWEYEAGG